MIRVLLADDHSIVRAALARIVGDSGDIEVVAEAATAGKPSGRSSKPGRMWR